MIRAIKLLENRHPILRARFTKSKSGHWEQHLTAFDQSSVQVQYLRNLKSDGVLEAIWSARAGPDIKYGPLATVILFEDEDTMQASLFISIHQLVVDSMSWRILFSELEEFSRLALALLHLVSIFQLGRLFELITLQTTPK